jgi:DNA transposition AAA+ family ATPase
MPPKPSPKEVVVRLTRALQGSCDSRAPAYDLVDELCVLLAEHPRVVVVDEAQNLSKEGLSQLRYLHDRPDACWALLFVGASNCAQVLKAHPELPSRVARWVHFQPLTDDELLQALRAFHPLLAEADARLLARVDETYAKRVFRRWARLTEIAVPLAHRRRESTLSTATARAALAAMPQ